MCKYCIDENTIHATVFTVTTKSHGPPYDTQELDLYINRIRRKENISWDTLKKHT